MNNREQNQEQRILAGLYTDQLREGLRQMPAVHSNQDSLLRELKKEAEQRRASFD